MPKFRSSHLPSLATITRQLDSVFGLTLASQVERYLSVIRKETHARGVRTTCKYLKDLYAQALRLASGLEPEVIPFRRANKKGFDRNLTPFRKYLVKGSPMEKRACLTVLRLCYLLEAPPVLDLEPIKSKAEGDGLNTIIAEFSLFAKAAVRRVSVEGAIEMPPRARSGPNGPSSFGTAHLDAVALTQRPELLQALGDLASLVDPLRKGEPESTQKGNDPVSNPVGSATKEASECGDPLTPTRELGLIPWLKSLKEWTVKTWSLDPDVRLPVSRLALLAEGGCKTRTIAIVDLFTQAVLRPIHDKLMKRLNTIESDCTHNQLDAVDYLKDATANGASIYSFDLTSATDRFPLELQEAVISAMFGDQVGVLWGKVISRERDFTYKSGKTELHNIYYGRGQPMGAYSSWPAFAYSHHVLVQWCAYKVLPRHKRDLRVWEFQDYRIIGDDVIIANELVAERYRHMLDVLEVPISKTKSMVSKGTPITSGEIAKRFVVGGVDLSPIPPDLLKLVQRHFTMLPALLNEVSSRYGLSCSTLLGMQSLTQLYRKATKKRKASILLAAPAVFALYGYPYYGKLERGDEPSEESDLQTIVSNSPWSETRLGTISNSLDMTQIATKERFYLRQYDEAVRSWASLEELTVSPPRGLESKTKATVPDDHPILKARALVCSRQKNTLIAHAKWRLGLPFSEKESEDSLLRGLGFLIGFGSEVTTLKTVLDPSLRSFLTRKREESSTASNLTLEVLRILRGDKKFPTYQTLLDDPELRELYTTIAAMEDPEDPVAMNRFSVFGSLEVV